MEQALKKYDTVITSIDETYFLTGCLSNRCTKYFYFFKLSQAHLCLSVRTTWMMDGHLLTCISRVLAFCPITHRYTTNRWAHMHRDCWFDHLSDTPSSYSGACALLNCRTINFLLHTVGYVFMSYALASCLNDKFLHSRIPTVHIQLTSEIPANSLSGVICSNCQLALNHFLLQKLSYRRAFGT